jgi:hypothetical protein
VAFVFDPADHALDALAGPLPLRIARLGRDFTDPTAPLAALERTLGRPDAPSSPRQSPAG